MSGIFAFVCTSDNNQKQNKQQLDLAAQKKLLNKLNHIKCQREHISYKQPCVNDAIETYLTIDVYSPKELQAGVEFFDSMKKSDSCYENFVVYPITIFCLCCSNPNEVDNYYNEKLLSRSYDNAIRALTKIKRD